MNIYFNLKSIHTILCIFVGLSAFGQINNPDGSIKQTDSIKIIGRMPHDKNYIIVSKSKKLGLLREDSYGKCDTILKCKYDRIQPFENNFHNNWYYVTKNGLTGYYKGDKEILPIKYKTIEYVPDGPSYDFKAILPNGAVKYFDYNGIDKTIFGKNGYTIVYADDWDRTSKTILKEPIAYVVRKNNKLGVINKRGRIIIPISYNDFTYYNNHYVFSKRNTNNSGETLYIYTLNGRLKASKYFSDGSSEYSIEYWVDKHT